MLDSRKDVGAAFVGLNVVCSASFGHAVVWQMRLSPRSRRQAAHVAGNLQSRCVQLLHAEIMDEAAARRACAGVWMCDVT